MVREIHMPELGSDMTEADLVQWLVAVGDRVETGDLIAEFETDKSTVEYETPLSGVIVELCIPAPTSGVPIGALIARIEESASEVDEAPAPQPAEAAAAEAPSEAVAPARPEVEEELADDPVPPAEPADEHSTSEDGVAATALARRIAQREGVDLKEVEPTGVGGRVTKADVEAAGVVATEKSADAAFVPLSRMRRTIAKRMSAAKSEMPHFYLEVDCNAGSLIEVRKILNDRQKNSSISLNDLCVAAAARALRDVPAANVAFRGDSIEQFSRCDIAVAVATDSGLITPVLRDAANLGLQAIATRLRDLVERARNGQLTPAEYQGGFTLSNLGMFGITAVWPILNPPHACILGIGGVEQVPVVEDGRVVPGSVMRCTLSADHRAVDGAVGAQWLARFRHYVEDPRAMIL